MSDSTTNETKTLETVEPVGMRVLIRRDPLKNKTKSGIHLPDDIKIPTLTGRILAISPQVKQDADYSNLREYQKVLFNPIRAVPVDFEDKETPRFIVPVDDVVGTIGKTDGETARSV